MKDQTNANWIEKVTWPELFSNYLNYTSKFSEAPSEFHLLTCMFTVSSLIGRSRYFIQGEDTIYPNQYCLVVAPTSLFKKTSANALSRKWLIRLDGMKSNFLGQVGSPEGLFQGLSANNGTGILYYSEMGLLLAQSGKKYMGDILEMLNDLYDCQDYYARRLASRFYEVSNVYLNLMGASQLDSLSRHVRESDLLSGFLPRFTVVYSENLKPHLVRRPPPDEVLQEKILRGLRKSLKAVEHQQQMDLTPEAWRVFETWALERHRDAMSAPPQLKPMFGRIETHCLKLSIILAVAQDPSVTLIGSDVVKIAIACADFVVNSYRRLVTEELTFTKAERKLKRVEEIMRSKGSISHRDLSRLTRYLDKELNEITRALISMGKVKVDTGPRGGKIFKWLG